MTVAVLLDQLGGMCETRHKINQPLARERYGAGQIDFVPDGVTIWGVAENLRWTRSLRLYFPPGLLNEEIDVAKTIDPKLMQYDARVFGCAALLASECDAPSLGKMYAESLTLAISSALFAANKTGDVPGASRFTLARWQVRRTIEYFEAHLGNEVVLKNFAAEVGLSQSRLARAFKQSTGVSPYR